MPRRSIPEWKGMTPDAAIPARVLLRVFERADKCCALCSQRLRAGRWHADHIKPLWAATNGENLHRETNLHALCEACHAGKTGKEAGQRAEAVRHRKKAAGIKRRRRKMPYRKFDGTPVWPD